VTLLARLSAGDASTDKVFNALSYKGGAPGFDVMYLVFERFPSSYAARRAEDTLRQAFDRLSPALQVTWGLRTTACEDKDKESLFERAGEMGDERTLALLVMMQDTRCRRVRGQCCLPGNRAIANAIARLQSKRRE
jgi:hypothetical protein